MEGFLSVEEKKKRCKDFIAQLERLLSDRYERIPSCNKDESVYLVPTGTADQISYQGKPYLSFRYSDHWNWYANLSKCPKYSYIQCLSVDVPWARRRVDERATRPIKAIQVAVVASDGKYHHVYGEKFSRSNESWTWVEQSPEAVVANLETL